MDSHEKTILVAEDDESNRNLLALLLEQAQYEVRLAPDGYEALHHMFTGAFDAVITDWDMPRLNGTDFLSISRVLWPKIPVIIVSAHEAPSPERTPRGAFAWLQKPYGTQELLQILHTAVHATAHRHEECPIVMPARG